jgi:hypothetical protein
MRDITVYLFEPDNLGFVEYGEIYSNEYLRPKVIIVYCNTREIYEGFLQKRSTRPNEC